MIAAVLSPNIDLDELETLARAASPGEWVAKVTDGGTDIESKATDEVVCFIEDNDEDEQPAANWSYIRAAQPRVILELVRLARLGLAFEFIQKAQQHQSGEPSPEFILCDESALGLLESLGAELAQYDHYLRGVQATMDTAVRQQVKMFPADFQIVKLPAPSSHASIKQGTLVANPVRRWHP